MIKALSDFFSRHWDGQSPLLLGYSGGPDSKALLYAAMEAGFGRTLHLAHVDHGWREESGLEALQLRKEAEALGLPFHAIRLERRVGEAKARAARFSFFVSLFKKMPFQALLLAHQADDAAETTLKRILEGAHLPFQGGMGPISYIEGIAVWRPFLSIEKRELSAFLEKKRLDPLIDPTNFDSSYTRARMRTEILPSLAEQFGKGISENLALHGARAMELRAYLDRKTERLSLSRGPWGLLGSLDGVERIEARHALQKWAEAEKIRLPRSLLELALDSIARHLPDCRLAERLFIDRGHVFLLKERFPSWGKEPLQLKVGFWKWGDWDLEVSVAGDERGNYSTWKEVWSGRFTSLAPQGILRMPLPGSFLRHHWNAQKVPSLLRYSVPIVWNGDKESHEFLTGKFLPKIIPYFKLVFSTLSGPIL